jgi:phosphate transport system substrate-binding protein
MSGVTFNSDFTADVNDPADGYPIVGLTWLLVQTDYKDAAKAKEMQRLLRWILTTGQGINNQLEFTRIPESVTKRILTQVDRIK